MATFKWKPLAEYSQFGQLLATFMWEQRPPLNPTQFADLTQIEYLTVYRWFTYNTAPDPTHLLRIAQHTPLTVQDLFVAAGYSSETFPLFSLTEAWDHIREQVVASTAIGFEEHDIALKVLQQVRDDEMRRSIRDEYPAESPTL